MLKNEFFNAPYVGNSKLPEVQEKPLKLDFSQPTFPLRRCLTPPRLHLLPPPFKSTVFAARPSFACRLVTLASLCFSRAHAIVLRDGWDIDGCWVKVWIFCRFSQLLLRAPVRRVLMDWPCGNPWEKRGGLETFWILNGFSATSNSNFPPCRGCTSHFWIHWRRIDDFTAIN